MEALVNAIKQLGSKVTDQAHLGKLITDFTPGLLVVFTLLLTLDAFSGFEVLPYLNGERYDERADVAQVNLRHATRAVENVRASIVEAEKAANAPDLKAIDIADLDEQLKLLQAAKVPVSAEIAAVRARRLSDLKAQAEAKVQKELQHQRLAPLRAELDARREREREREQELVAAQLRAAEARTLAANLEKLGEHAVSLLTIAMLVGAVLAQVSGLIFYNGLFYRFMKSARSEHQTGRGRLWEILYGEGRYKYRKEDLTHEGEAFYRGLLHDVRRHAASRPAASAADAHGAGNVAAEAGSEDLTGYFRYLEIAMNSIIPCGLFALAVIAIAARSLHRDLTGPGWSGLSWLLLALLILVAVPAAAYMLQQRRRPPAERLTTWLRDHPFAPWIIALGLSGGCLVLALGSIGGATWSLLALAGASVLVSVALYYNARALYIGYFVKRAEAMLLVYHQLHETKERTNRTHAVDAAKAVLAPAAE